MKSNKNRMEFQPLDSTSEIIQAEVVYSIHSSL